MKIDVLYFHDKWVPVTMALWVLRLWLEEWPPVWRVAANILNKQLRTADRGLSYSLGLDEVVTTPHHKNVSCYKPLTKRVADTCAYGNEPSGSIK